MARLLVVDDEPAMLFAVQRLMKGRPHETVLARSGREALALLDGVDAVVADYAMPGMDGLELLRSIRERDAALPVVILTAQGSERVAVQAMKGGAYEYVTKPFDIDEMARVIERALETHAERLERRPAAPAPALVGDAPPVRRLLDAVQRIAPRDITVLVRGETGTGKELVASLVHARSRRAAGPLVRFSCAAIPDALAEAELFGHVRGAFTGATESRRGYFAQADGGTLVLDEVGELPAPLQAKLLRALQSGELQRVGADRVERVDVRVVACTHRDLAAEVRAGRFREDLYYRLAVVELLVPPLRERREDIPALAAEFARRYGARFGVGGVRLAPALVERLAAAEWPGNVRELENAVARMVALSRGGELGPGALDEVAPGTTAEAAVPYDPALTLREHLERLERRVLADALRATGGNQTVAARRLGVSRSSFIDRMKKFGVTG